MKIDFEQQDIETIALRVAEILKPVISKNDRSGGVDMIFDVKGLASYLHVNENWIYQRTRKQEIPYIKKGKYCLFKKSAIDAWLNEDAVKPLSPFNILKK
ncbi:MAG: helix-turn-helix domain-containing protein [Syntrophales bacterium]|jgi:excisionase family DNA binding protein